MTPLYYNHFIPLFRSSADPLRSWGILIFCGHIINNKLYILTYLYLKLFVTSCHMNVLWEEYESNGMLETRGKPRLDRDQTSNQHSVLNVQV